MVLAADFIFDATAEQRTGFQLTLTSDGANLNLVDSVSGTVVKTQSHAANSGAVVIKGTQRADSLTIDRSLPAALTVLFVGGDGVDNLRGPSLDSDWKVTGNNTGSLNDQVTFMGVENLIGATDNKDEFTFASVASLSGKVDGGARGFDTLVVEGRHNVGRIRPPAPIREPLNSMAR